MTDLLVNAIGVALIGLILWWFWLAGPRAQRIAATGAIEILVDDGVYTPASIEVPVGRPVILRFVRKDPNPCAGQVIFGSLGISADLPMGKPRDISLSLDEAGEYEFSCQMGMYRGRLLARAPQGAGPPG